MITTAPLFADLSSLMVQHENTGINRIFEFRVSDQKEPMNIRRVEVHFSGGDWMTYPLIYFLTDAEQIRVINGKPVGYYPGGAPYRRHYDDPRAYFIKDLSTSDFENGEIPPVLDIFRVSNKEIIKYIKTKFLTKDGMVQGSFVPVCKDLGSAGLEKPCRSSRI